MGLSIIPPFPIGGVVSLIFQLRSGHASLKGLHLFLEFLGAFLADETGFDHFLTGLALMRNLNPDPLEPTRLHEVIDLLFGSIHGFGNFFDRSSRIGTQEIPYLQKQLLFRAMTFGADIPRQFHHNDAAQAAGDQIGTCIGHFTFPFCFLTHPVAPSMQRHPRKGFENQEQFETGQKAGSVSSAS